MKNYRKTRTSLKKTKFLSIWTAVFVFAASLVLIGCPNQANSPAGGGESTQGTTITINYKSEELSILKWDTAAKKWADVTSGIAVDEGTELFFDAKNVPSGNMVDKWILNGKTTISGNGNGCDYTVKLADAVDEGGKKVIKVERTFKSAASITIKYNSGEIEMKKWNTTSEEWDELPPNTPVDEGSDLRFIVKNKPSGKIFDKWLLNDKKEVKLNYYSVSVEDSVEEGGKKVIKVERILKDAASITINYNSDELTVRTRNTSNEEWKPISSGTEVYEGSHLSFKAKNISPEKALDKWLLNGKREVKPGYYYSVSAKDAIDEGGKKVIKVERILKDAASITINYNPAELIVKKNTDVNWTENPSGTAVYEGTHLRFYAKDIPSGKTVNEWILNGKKITSNGNDLYYILKAEDAVEQAGKKVIEVRYSLKDAASITIEYDESLIMVGKIDLATNESSPVPTGTTVYEGSTLFFAPKGGHTVNKWVLNGKKEVKPRHLYWVEAKDAVDEGDKKVIRVTFE